MRFANALTQYIDKTADYPLIVDDVLTTGKSMNEEYQKLGYAAVGVVIFSRIENYPVWVYPIFKLIFRLLINDSYLSFHRLLLF